jgi:pimeloyl-ACP methyl ester carboxylesterase
MPTLEALNATLYYETFGTGPLLLFIPGANGSGSVFHPVAKALSTHFTAVCWDRRGYSRSVFTGSQDFANRLSTDADDAKCLIQHLSKDGQQATVFGTSSGAIVALNLLVQHPDCAKTVIAHEPPAFNVLPEEYRIQGTGLINHVYDIYRAHGPITAMETFTAALSDGDEGSAMRECMDSRHSDEIRANALFWFEFELRQYPSSDLDLPALIKNKEKFVPAAGIDSGMGPGVAPILAIAGAMEREVVRVVGGHIGYLTQPDKWATNFLKAFNPDEE